MPWWQLTVQCSQQELEQTEDILLELGAISLTLSDAHNNPIYEPLPGDTPVWPVLQVTGLFEQTRPLEDIYDDLVKILPGHQLSTIDRQQLQDEAWERTFLDRYKPIKFGDRLWICPSWHRPPVAEASNIILDPGLAFGTGSHPTTALCLEFLDQHPPLEKTVIDYGCGSGILAIAAYKLGASRISSIDIDPQALLATAKNAERNAIDPAQMNISLPDKLTPNPVDYLMANILSGPLIDLEPKFSQLTRPGSQLLLSGILAAQQNDIVDAYQEHFNLEPVKIKDDWCRVTGIRKR